MKIYTKTGDYGETGLGQGKRAFKDSVRIAAYGDVDEANAAIGLAFTECSNETKTILQDVQKDLLNLGADLAISEKTLITTQHVEKLEQKIDVIDEKLEELTNFIIPSGAKASALLHCARTVVRRAERSVAHLARTEQVNPQCLIYLNRLSDLLFVLARFENKLAGVKEEKWSE